MTAASGTAESGDPAAPASWHSRPLPRHGRRQRHPRLVQRRRPVVRARRRDRARLATARRGRRHPRRRRRVDPARRRAPAAVQEELRRVLPVVERPGRRRAPCVSIDTMRAEVADRALAAGRRARQRRQRRPRGPRDGARWSPRPACRSSPCTGAARATAWRSTAVYGDVVADVCAELTGGSRRCVDAGHRRRAASCSTPASASPSWPPTTGACSPASTRWSRSATRCSSARRASASSAGSGAARGRRPAPAPGARRRDRRHLRPRGRWPASGRAGARGACLATPSDAVARRRCPRRRPP